VTRAWVGLLFAATACDGGAQPVVRVAVPAPLVEIDAQVDAGTIRGRVVFVGEAPPPRPIAMGGTDACGRAPAVWSETLVIGNEGIANVLVRVKSDLGVARWPESTEPAVIDQRGCVFVPHVVALRTGQPLHVRNGDPTTHNVNGRPQRAGNEAFNKSHAPGADELVVAFAEPELAIPLRCDVHPWMQAWVHVLEHPFFGLSDARGAFEIGGLPPGRYELEALHEWLGRKTFEVVLDGKSGARVTCAFGPPSSR
jgi:hypothetical protein